MPTLRNTTKHPIYINVKDREAGDRSRITVYPEAPKEVTDSEWEQVKNGKVVRAWIGGGDLVLGESAAQDATGGDGEDEVTLEDVAGGMADRLREAGIDSAITLAQASAATLTAIEGIGPARAEQLIGAAQDATGGD